MSRNGLTGIGRLAGVILLASWCAVHAAVDLGAAVEQARLDVHAARQELTQTHERIRAEKQAAVREVDQIRERVRTLAEKEEQAATDLEQLRRECAQLQQQLEQLGDAEEQIRNVVLEYRQAFESRLPAVDAERYSDSLGAVDAALESQPQGVGPGVLQELIDVAAEHATGGFGGRRTAGAASDLDGVRHDGVFVRVGPLAFFRADDGGLAGVAVQQVGSLLPTVFQGLAEEQLAAIERLYVKGRSDVPLDVTLGSAIQLQQTRESWSEHLRKGGVTMIPLLILAAVCAVIVVYKIGTILTLAGAGAQATVGQILEALSAGEAERAVTLADGLRRPLGPVIREGIDHRHASKEHLEEILYEQILNQVPRLERFLSPLAVCASAAPLLGLLGTVTGMIHTFRLITVFGTGDARLLSSGISEALITTEVGLIVAIPALLFHAYLSRRIRRAVSLAQETAVTFVNGLKLRGGGGE